MSTDRAALARADEFFSMLVRARARRCARCGKAGQRNSLGLFVKGLECAHIFPRRYWATRVDEDNAIALCGPCHADFTGHPFRWENWVIARIGRPAWDALRAKAHSQVTVDWKVEAIRLRGDIQRLQRAA